MFVDIAQPTVLELWDKVVSILPGILKALSEVGFGKVPGDGLRTAPCRESMYIAYYVFRRRLHFGSSLASRSSPSASITASL